MIQRIKNILGRGFFLKKNKQTEIPGISEHERLLAAYFDGELSPSEAEAFKRQNLDIVGVEQELEGMNELRSEFRSLVDDMYLQTNQGSGTTSIWQQIEVRVHAEARTRVGEQSSLSSSLFEFVKPFFQPRAAFAGAAGLAMAFMFGVRFGAGTIPEQVVVRQGSLASNFSNTSFSDPFETSPVSPNPNFALVSASSSSQDSSINLKVARQSAIRNVMEHRIPLRVDTDQLIGLSSNESIRGGLRTEGADIDWIESDRKFKILPANKERVVPVIWVSRENSK